MTVAHFYHVYADGDWRDSVAEHLWALSISNFDGPFHIGVVGSPENRAAAIREISTIRKVETITEADQGWEQVTLRRVHAYTKAHGGHVLYAHTKGASSRSPGAAAWRRSMMFHVVLHWHELARRLQDEQKDAAGCYWIQPPNYRNHCFAGTFWIATCAYLASLPRVIVATRWDAEQWIGRGDPDVIDLVPGWPDNFPAVRYGRLVASHA